MTRELSFKAVLLAICFQGAIAPAFAEPPRATPAYNWTGFYAGGHLGYGWHDVDAGIGLLFFGGPVALTDGMPPGASGKVSGVIAGGQAGYSVQVNRAVFGLEADLSYSDIRGQAALQGVFGLGGPPVTTNLAYGFSQNLNWLATVRGRFGYNAFDSALIYFTGGMAIGEVETPGTIAFSSVGGSTTYSGTNSSTRTGWTVGGGVDYALNRNWSVKAEYLFVDLGGVPTTILNPSNAQPTQFTINTSAARYNIVRTGFNYRF